MSKIADIDSMISISKRVEALRAENAGFREAGDRMARSLDFMLSEHDRMQAENDQLRAKLAEHETLFAVAIGTDDFLQKLLDGLGGHLPPYTVRSVDGIVDAVASMALKLDAHEDASTPAFDEIAKLCGCPEWEYPGQVVRDVERVVKERDELVNATILGPLKGKSMHDEIASLRERLRVAEAVRDDARVASQRDLERAREATARAEELDREIAEMAKRERDLYAHPRAWMPSNPPTLESPGQCPWILDDEDPDEGYWHCRLPADHVGVHETEFGAGRDRRWMMRGNLLPGDTHEAQKPPSVCACSPKYRELAPGVHAAYCPLAGKPT